MVCDANGKVFEMELENFTYKCVLNTNSGQINDMKVLENLNAFVTIKKDSTVCLYDTVNKREFYKR